MSGLSSENNWLSLSEYSAEYGLSVSTLRRRIKGNQIRYKLVNGKYFLPRHDSNPYTKASAPVPTSEAKDPVVGGSDNSFHTAKSLLDELKKAYMQSLQSKEEQILQLKQQITDLKTLVMYLEREVEKSGSSNSPN
ncbi:MAG: hypothetical protein KDD33_08415 [Bdellovibrionales bacterium]|nr:hypothetical protein [Bdellovibrionales bacterium]